MPTHALLQAITTNDLAVDDNLLREEVVYYREVALVETFVDPTANESFVAIRGGSSVGG